jgi:hypothetical protein
MSYNEAPFGRVLSEALKSRIGMRVAAKTGRKALMKDRDQYWFPAKRRGWGWGPPTVWQGWAVLLGILGANILAAVALMPRHLVGFLCFVLATVLLMLLICSVKGEPPAWR